MTQTSIFKELAISKIKGLLDMLNEGLKLKDQYMVLAVEAHEGVYIIEVINNKGDRLWNIIDFHGDTPKDMSVNWRIFPEIIKDLEGLAK